MCQEVKTIKQDLNKTYGRYCRPATADLMQKIRMDKIYHRASGDHLYYQDDEGKEVEVIDFLGGYGASIFGHQHPELIKVMKDNLDQQVPFNAQASIRPYTALLGEMLNNFLLERTGTEFITTIGNTGADAVEAAIKHAELAHQDRIQGLLNQVEKQAIPLARKLVTQPFKVSEKLAAILAQHRLAAGSGTPKEILKTIMKANERIFGESPFFLSLDKSFHGKTNGALQLTHNSEYRKPFSRLGIRSIFLQPENEADLKMAVKKAQLHYYIPRLNKEGILDVETRQHTNITALFVEPIQGEGGIRPISNDYLQLCREYATVNRFALVFDEIQCGMGRTGRFLASERSGVVADYYLLGKSLSGGTSKISAMMVQSSQYLPDFGMIHTSTFTEDDWSARLALRSLELLDEERIYSKCKVRGAFLMMLLGELQAKYPKLINGVSGKGLMIGLQFADFTNSNSFVLRALSQQKLLGYVIAGFLLNHFNIRVAPALSSNATLRFEPSFMISKASCISLYEALDKLCQVLAAENSHALLGYTLGIDDLPEEIEDFAAQNAPHATGEEEEKNITKVGFMGHFIHADHLSLWDPSFASFTSDQRKELLDRFHGAIQPCVYDHITVQSKQGNKVQFNFIGLFIDSDLIMKGLRERNGIVAQELVENAVKLAEQEGFKALGFGGFSSIVSRNCKNVDSWDVAMTTGNSYTVASGVQAMFHAAGAQNIDLQRAHLAAIGANGNICSIYCEMMAEEVGEITLISRAGREKTLHPVEETIYEKAFESIRLNPGSAEELKGIARSIYHTNAVQSLLKQDDTCENVGAWLADALDNELGLAKPVHKTSELESLVNANLIVAASSTPEPIIFPDMLGQRPTIICDIAVPQDVDPSVATTRQDVTVIGGGIIELPRTANFKLGGVPLQSGEAYACMSETMLMGLSGINEHFSIGSVELEKVQQIARLADFHGFSIGKLKTERSF